MKFSVLINDTASVAYVISVLGLLVCASIVGRIAAARVKSKAAANVIANLNARTRAWWMMVVVFVLALATGEGGTLTLFAIISFLALREVVTLSPTRRADHHTLFWAFFVMIPIQYVLLYVHWYGLFAIFIPVYGFLFLAVRSTLTGDATRYFERAGKIYWSVMICIYCVSYAPALLLLTPPSYKRMGAWLLIFLITITQLSDVFQYVWGKLLGRRRIAPHLSPGKTWGGFIGGVATATAIGALMAPLTPFSAFQAAELALMISLMGFFGGLVMSAIKRDAGVKDYGNLIAGHGGMMDRIDSICFAAPVFFHAVRYAWS